jgi:hypothetical protein
VYLFPRRGSDELLYCEKCGAKLPSEAQYCPSCGHPVGKIATEKLSISADNLVQKVKELIQEGNVTRIIIKDEKGRVLLEMPATIGVIGALLAPWLAALGAIAALATNCTLVIERKE